MDAQSNALTISPPDLSRRNAFVIPYVDSLVLKPPYLRVDDLIRVRVAHEHVWIVALICRFGFAHAPLPSTWTESTAIPRSLLQATTGAVSHGHGRTPGTLVGLTCNCLLSLFREAK
jgi:hypothetical protein